MNEILPTSESIRHDRPDIQDPALKEPPRKRLRVTDNAAISTKEADPDTALEVDIMILDHLAYQATQICLGGRSETADVSSPGPLLSTFDGFHSIFHARHPRYKPDSELRLRILLLKLVVLFTQRLTRNPSTPSLEALTALRQKNRERAERWFEGVEEITQVDLKSSRTRVPETPRKSLKHLTESPGTASPQSMRKSGSIPFTWDEDNIILLDSARLKLSVKQTLKRYPNCLHHLAPACHAQRRDLSHEYGGSTSVQETLSQMPKSDDSQGDEDTQVPGAPSQEPPHVSQPPNTIFITPFPTSPRYHCLSPSPHSHLSLSNLSTNRATLLSTLSTPAEAPEDDPFTGTPSSPNLLDLLPFFMEISHLRNSSYNANLSEQWMHLAAEWGMWAVWEAVVIRGEGDVGAIVREAFFWGYRPDAAGEGEDGRLGGMFASEESSEETPAWERVKGEYLSTFLVPASDEQGRDVVVEDEMLARLEGAGEEFDLPTFELVVRRFLSEMAASLNVPVLAQLEGGRLEGMTEEGTRGFLRGCGLRGGWRLG